VSAESAEPLPTHAPTVTRLTGRFGAALTVDVEEWYHTCMVPDYVEPARRPPGLARQLDHLLPELLAFFAELGCRATFFTLGEVAEEVPARIREIADAGHELASHGFHHLRVGQLSVRRFRADVARSKALLEDLVGKPVVGYRAPEWSLRAPGNPRLRVLAELGFAYDSSLAPSIGAGHRDNPLFVSRLEWSGGASLVELPPLTFAGRLQLPAGGWPGRIAGPAVVAKAAREHHAAGGLPVMVVHPWELAPGETPGELTGLARWVHELGRPGYRERFREIARALQWRTLSQALGPLRGGAPTTLEVDDMVPTPQLGLRSGDVRAALQP
jgi:polysaccharide deacetylase family protein (PEP-CTERM system associated)